nr:uncharacterized protein LOC109425457 [Aedes albopictus]
MYLAGQLPNLLLLLQLNLLSLVFGAHVMYEHFRQINGTEFVDAQSVRIRKLNRTTTTMNGTVTVKRPLDNSFTVAMHLFHSPLGNNQFNYYPMKIPTIGVCDFMRKVYPTYYPHFKKAVLNLPPTSDCPIQPRVVYIRDYVVSESLVPELLRFVPKGLWLVRLTGKRNGEILGITETMSKVYSNYDW